MRSVWVSGTESGGPPSGARGERADSAAQRHGRTILVVDDDTSILETVGEILSQEGYHVVRAAGGEEALALIRRSKPALILLDMRMPGMDGWAVARALREREIDVP